MVHTGSRMNDENSVSKNIFNAAIRFFLKCQAFFFLKVKISVCFLTKFPIHNLCIQLNNLYIEIFQKSDIIIRKEIIFIC